MPAGYSLPAAGATPRQLKGLAVALLNGLGKSPPPRSVVGALKAVGQVCRASAPPESELFTFLLHAPTKPVMSLHKRVCVVPAVVVSNL